MKPRNPFSRPRRPASNAGFSMTEVMVSSMLMLVVVAAVLGTFTATTRNFKTATNYGSMRAEARFLVDTFSRDFREAMGIANYEADRIVLLLPAGFNSQGSVTGTTSMEYKLVGQSLRRRDLNSDKTTTLADGVNAVAFTMFDRVGQTTSLTANCKGCDMNIKLKRTVAGAAQTEDSVSARLVLRNKP